MNAVAFYTCSGISKAVAERLSEKTDFPLFDICGERLLSKFETLAVVFPVHCQGLPKPVKSFLKSVNAERFVFIAVYGRAAAGNAVFEAAKAVGNKVIAAAYLPAPHTYNGGERLAPVLPEEITAKISNPSFVKIPRRLKAPFAGVLTNARSRALIKIKKSEKCVNCNICGGVCPQHALSRGVISGNCSRCLKCVFACPQNALTAEKSRLLARYLSKPRMNKVIIYT